MSRRRRNKVRPAKVQYADGFRRFMESFAGAYTRLPWPPFGRMWTPLSYDGLTPEERVMFRKPLFYRPRSKDERFADIIMDDPLTIPFPVPDHITAAMQHTHDLLVAKGSLAHVFMPGTYTMPTTDLDVTKDITARQTEIAIGHLARKDYPAQTYRNADEVFDRASASEQMRAVYAWCNRKPDDFGLIEPAAPSSQTTEIVDRWPSKATGAPRNEHACLRRGGDFRHRCHLAAGHEGECQP